MRPPSTIFWGPAPGGDPGDLPRAPLPGKRRAGGPKGKEEEAKIQSPAAGDPAVQKRKRKRKRRSNFAGSCNWKGADGTWRTHRRKGGLRKGAGRGGPRGGRLEGRGGTPGLAVVIVGDDPASRIYVNNKKKACQATGIHSEEYALPASTTQGGAAGLSGPANHKKDIHGILVQSPLPKGLDEGAVVEAIDPPKDVDAFHAYNVGKIMIGDYHFLPCTPAGIMELLKAYEISVEGKRCVVIGRSNIVESPWPCCCSIRMALSPFATAAPKICRKSPAKRTSWSPRGKAISSQLIWSNREGGRVGIPG